MDGTLGGGGHSYEICRHLSDKGRLIGIDQDAAAIEAAKERLGEFGDKVTIIRSNYCNMVKELKRIGISSADGIILDLGVSSHQLDTAERGFTYREDAPLDMRDGSASGYDRKRYCEWIQRDGAVPYHPRLRRREVRKNIAKHIVNARQQKEIETTGELIQIIKAAIPMKVRAVGGHPAKKTFQAIRIELNRELEVLKGFAGQHDRFLNDGGRICVITFHSLEDRIVKTTSEKMKIRVYVQREFPVCVCGRKSKGFMVTRKPIIPGEEELTYNKRAKAPNFVFSKEDGRKRSHETGKQRQM